MYNIEKQSREGVSGMNYGYARCSTNESKQDITRQTNELEQYGVPKDNIYLEYESGTKVDRAELSKLLSVVRETSLDKGTQRKTTENELPSLTQCTA